MAENSAIQWCGPTFNPWSGCTKVSAGCAHCYAEVNYSVKMRGVKWGPQGNRIVASESMWKQPLKWNRLATSALGAWALRPAANDDPMPQRPRVFCASLADVFEDWPGTMLDAKGQTIYRSATGGWLCGSKPSSHSSLLRMQDVRARLFALIDATPNLDWLLLTKRPENVAKMMPPSSAWVETGMKIWQLESPVGSRHFRGIVWGDTDQPHFSMPGGFTTVSTYAPPEEHDAGERGTVAECRAEVERRFSAVRSNLWLGTSVENRATLHRIDELRRVPAAIHFLSLEPLLEDLGTLDLTGIAWVIVGGESGPSSRPCNVAWVRSIVEQCKAAGVSCFVKQLGSAPYDPELAKLVPGSQTKHSAEEAKNATPEMLDTLGKCLDVMCLELRDKKGGDPEEWDADLRVREFPKAVPA